MAVVGLCLLVVSDPVWAESDSEKHRTIVAAGFGYQIGAASTIAVKVYDAASGTILSDEVYELTVKEGDGTRLNRGPRIFAGGVGLGATDLSDFVLRVYDANTGVFQWEGRLNLVQPDKKGKGQVISTTRPRRATITESHVVRSVTEQPVFSLRALDTLTGFLVWEDEFTTVRASIPTIQRIARQFIQSNGNSTGSSHTFAFRIRMYDPSGHRVLWEDQLSRLDSDEEGQESFSDQASMLPVWPHQPQEEFAEEAI